VMPLISYDRAVMWVQWMSVNGGVGGVRAATMPISPLQVMDDAALMESWRWNYTCELADQVRSSMGHTFYRRRMSYVMHGGRAARRALWNGAAAAAILPHADVVEVCCPGLDRDRTVDYGELLRVLGERATPTAEGVEIIWNAIPEDVLAFLRTQPGQISQSQDLMPADLIEASVARRLAGQ
jgi:hypothetical protein